jgi:hypothetical protein
MSRLARVLLTAVLLASFATTASAYYLYPPGPPYRSCPDSVTIFQVQQSDTTLNPCFPALNDTVWGVSGIVTAKRPRSTARLYIENSNAADFNALQIYVTDQTYNGQFALGDSVVAYGVVNDYQGETQLGGTVGVNKIVRKISSGNPLPPFRMHTTTDLRYTPATGSGSAYATAITSEGALVKVDGPLKVARTTTVNVPGLFANTNWLLVNGDGSAPGDSILIDGYTLTPTNISNPPLGYTVDWVQGILGRATNNGVDCWLIRLRGPDDQSVQGPPNLSEAYPIADNKLRVIFDNNLDITTAEDEANYALGSALSGSTVDLAELVGGAGAVVDLTITDVQPRLSLETIQTENIGSAACPGCLSSQQSRSFILGVLTPAELQAPNADSLAVDPCLDKSVFAGGGFAQGERVSVRGVFVQSYGSLYYIEGAAGGLRNGVSAYNPPYAMVAGNEYIVASRAQEYYTETELSNIIGVIDLGASAVPSPILETLPVLADGGCDPTQTITNAEDYEGVLVRVENVKVVPFNTDPTIPTMGGSFRVVGPYPTWTDTLLVSSLGDHYPNYTPVVGNILNINGVIHIDSDVPRIMPRSADDITPGTAGVTPTQSGISFAVSPNPARVSNVSFSLPRSADVDLSVFDLAGRKIATLAKGNLPAGQYTREWNGSDAGAGIYFVRLRVGAETYNLRTVSLK